jgi:glutamate/tyrosine decarboxylase-like PLP-dependent enzyme
MNAALFPSDSACRAEEDRLTRALADADARVRHGAAVPDFDRAAFDAELGRFDFEQPRPLAELCDWAIAQLEHGIVHMTHPRYLGLFNPAPTLPARAADRIVATFNPQLATATTSPAAVAIEAHVARALARRAGLPAAAAGHFTSGGSEANATALICALTRSAPGFAQQGARAFPGPPVFYISADSHLAWIKIAHAAGIGRSAARLVPTDGAGRMDIAALHAAIAADRAQGAVPFMVVATAGTTNAGAIDPLEPCRQAAAACGAWFHVDAAWAGALLASDTLRPLLAGVEAADSITIDAHKWFATTMACGMVLFAQPAILAEAFDVRTTYMPSHTPSADPYLTTLQWSRRFMGLRLFLSLGAAGWAGYAAHVERAVTLARRLAAGLEAAGWRVVNDPALAVVCARPPDGSAPVRTIVARILADAQAWLSAAVFEGEDVVRACVTHGQTTESDIDLVVDILTSETATRQ